MTEDRADQHCQPNFTQKETDMQNIILIITKFMVELQVNLHRLMMLNWLEKIYLVLQMSFPLAL